MPISVIALLMFSIGGCTHHTETILPEPETADKFQQFEAKLDSLRQKLYIPGMSVVILYKQEIVYKKGLGYADIENKILASPDTPYHIASLTKTFTAAILMDQVENGQLRLEDEMSVVLKDASFQYGGYHAHGYEDLCMIIRKLAWRYGPLLWDYRCTNEKILVKHHLTHTSQGLPGSRYRYNGFLFMFLTEVAENASRKPFDKLIVGKIVAPLKMTDTVPSINNELCQQTLNRRAKYYQKGIFGRTVPSTERPLELSASAGLISTVIDLAKFDVAMDRDIILSRASREMMHTATISVHNERLPYGLGWFVQNHKGINLIWHYGHVPNAYSSLIIKIPDKKLTMILLANSDGASRNFELGKGDVLKSPFARLFIGHSTGIMAASR